MLVSPLTSTMGAPVPLQLGTDTGLLLLQLQSGMAADRGSNAWQCLKQLEVASGNA